MTRGFIIAGTDTGAGKTVFSAALAGALDGRYWKPIQAGAGAATDSETVARLSGLGAARILPEAYVLEQPASPHIAARAAGITIDVARLARPQADLRVPARPLIVELAGGLLVPLDHDVLQIDLLFRWGLPVILVAPTRLGTINHCLLALEALAARTIPVHGLAFVGPPAADVEATVARMGHVKRLGRLPFLEPLTRANLAQAFALHFAVEDFR